MEAWDLLHIFQVSVPPGAHTVDCSQGSTEYDGPPVKARIVSSPLFKISRKFLDHFELRTEDNQNGCRCLGPCDPRIEDCISHSPGGWVIFRDNYIVYFQSGLDGYPC